MSVAAGEAESLAGSLSSRADQCRQELLEGIATLPQLGIPGRVVVYGDDAVPVLCGSQEEDVLVACAELGKGRIVIVGHNGYLIDMIGTFQDESVARFQSNIKQWVSGQTLANDSEIRMLKDVHGLEEIDGCKVVVWGGGKLVDGMLQKVIDFVMGGGGLVYGMTPWGWLQLNKGKGISDMPLYPILELVGVCYTKEYMGKNKEGFSISEAMKLKGGLHIQSIKNEADLHHILPNSNLQLSSLEHHRYCARKWRLEILHDISCLPKSGVPGNVVTLGSNAFPILSGENEADILLACAGFGNGRIAVLCHDRYLRHITGGGDDTSVRQLLSNLKNWVSNYTFQNDSDVCFLRNQAGMHLEPGCKIVVWKGGKVADEVLNFIRTGGGLICGVCPWGWLQQHRGKSIQDMPIYPVMKMAGIGLTGDVMYGNKEGFDVTASLQRESGGLHLAHALDQCLHPKFLEQHAQGLASVLRCLSDDIIQQLEAKFGQISSVYADEIQNCAPTHARPVTEARQTVIIALCEILCHHNMGMCKAPGINAFPGDFESLPPLHSADLKFESKHVDFHPTGFYLPAGVELTVKVTSIEGDLNWRVRIGAHTDKLYKKKQLTRWPAICTMRLLSRDSPTTLMSPYGGSIYLISPGGEAKLAVRLEGVVESPLFDLRDPGTRSEWERRRLSPGLWADISGQFITFTLPAKSVRTLEAPWEVMETWDRVVMTHHELRGTHPTDRRREFVVCDQQPSAGYMHSGHPIVTHLDVASPTKNGGKRFLLNNESLLATGKWGIFHELGHNMQRKWWTFQGTGEVTCNIFSLHAVDVICGTEPMNRSGQAMRKIANYLNGGLDLAEWRSQPGVALGVYAQLAHHFGWEPYKAVFRTYEDMAATERPDENQEKLDTWIELFSKAVEYNLCPLYELWGLPFSDTVKQALIHLPAWLPYDKMTNLALERVASISEKYPNITHHSGPNASDTTQELCQQSQEVAVSREDQHSDYEEEDEIAEADHCGQ